MLIHIKSFESFMDMMDRSFIVQMVFPVPSHRIVSRMNWSVLVN